MTSAELLAAAGAAQPSSGAVAATFELRTVAEPAAVAVELDWADHDEWAAERQRTLQRASRRTGIAATRLSEELDRRRRA